jgi:nitroimidazol reductase NimA-like FMN-containing flavoprotein (pyridoxamine 5'-phosphate oxidase superfamily)
VGKRILVARSYCLVTVRPDGRPHSVPVWSVWVEDSLHFGGGRSTRKARNLVANPNVVAHTESGEDVVILEGVVEEVTDPVLQERIDDADEAKYRIRLGRPVWVLKPRVVHAWSRFPADATRWVFRQSRSEKGTTVSKEEAVILGKSKQS